MSMETGRHLHHGLYGHGGERVICAGKEELKVDGYEPSTKTVYEYHGCKWHRCPCQPEANAYRYEKMKKKEKDIQDLGYNLVTIWRNI